MITVAGDQVRTLKLEKCQCNRLVQKYLLHYWGLIQAQTKKLQMRGMGMLRLKAGVTKLEGVRNEDVRGSLGITDIVIVILCK